MDKLNKLKIELQKAINIENYERAAELRDEIQALNNGETIELGEFSPVTKDDLEMWMAENGEDVVADGPFATTPEHWEEMGSRIYKKLIDMGVVILDSGEDWYDVVFDVMHAAGYGQDEAHDLVLDVFVEVINEYEICKY